MSKPQVPQEARTANQRCYPAADHPFRTAFSEHRMRAPDCNTRRAPCTPENKRRVNTKRPGHTTLAIKLPWHMRPLPGDWDADEVLFFRNWMKELATLDDTLTSTAAYRAKLLRKARHLYFKLAHKLDLQIRGATAQARGEAGRR